MATSKSKKVSKKAASKKASSKTAASKKVVTKKAEGIKAIGRSGTKAEKVRDIIAAGLKKKQDQKAMVDEVVKKVGLARALANAYVTNNLPKVKAALK